MYLKFAGNKTKTTVLPEVGKEISIVVLHQNISGVKDRNIHEKIIAM